MAIVDRSARDAEQEQKQEQEPDPVPLLALPASPLMDDVPDHASDYGDIRECWTRRQHRLTRIEVDREVNAWTRKAHEIFRCP